MATKKKIQISRSHYIEDSRAIAVLRLNTYDFKKGELVMLNYYKDQDFRNNIGVLIAIGVKDGIGEDCYRLISVGGTVPVRYVGELPDVSKLVHGEVYVWYGPEDNLEDTPDTWNYVYAEKPDLEHRVIEPITGGPYIFVDLETGYRWFYENQDCKREDDYFTIDKMEQLLQKILSSSVSLQLTSRNGTLFQVGEVKDLLLNVVAVDETGANISDQCSFYLSGIEIFPEESGRIRVPNVNKSTDFEIEARRHLSDNIYLTTSSTISIHFGYIFYYGRVFDGWTPSEGTLKVLENRVLSYRVNKVWDKINLTKQKTVFAYPKEYGYLSHIYDDHGLDFISTYTVYDEELLVDGVRYLVYVKDDIVDISNFKQKFVFENPEDLTAEGTTMLDIITAWKIRNTFNGLVQLDENGKINEDLYNINAAEAFNKLDGIYEDYPEDGMERGEVYYITSTKKLYTAISDTEGAISNPIPGMVYVYQDNYYTWSGLSLRPFGRITSRKINSITDIFN